MKINFKSLLIIFLVALLGSSIGTYTILKITDTKVNVESKNNYISTIEYKDFKPNELADTIDKAIETVVEINCSTKTTVSSMFGGSQTYESSSAGSGVIISENGYIVTNNHVVEGAYDVKVKTYQGKEYSAKIIGADSRSDIAVIKIDANNLAYSYFVDSDTIKLGQTVIAIGNPLGQGLTCSDGIISSLSKEITINDVSMTVLQTSAAVNEGNSGGGLFDTLGNIVGIVNAKSSDSTSSTSVEGMGYAIPSNTAKKIVNDLINDGFVRDRATIGVKVYSSSSYYIYQNISGAMISEIIDGYPAQKAGLKAGDIITKIDDYEITNYTDLAKTLDKYKVGDEIKIVINRNNKNIEYTLTLSEAIDK